MLMMMIIGVLIRTLMLVITITVMMIMVVINVKMFRCRCATQWIRDVHFPQGKPKCRHEANEATSECTLFPGEYRGAADEP